MMGKLKWLAAVLAVAALWALASSAYVVDESQQALIIRFGAPMGVAGEPGLKFKVPFSDSVVFYDSRLQTLLSPAEQVILGEDVRHLLHAQVLQDNAVVFESLALNDVTINRESTSGMIELRVEVDDHFVCNQRADGLIVATSTGSTAYALSAGGPLMHPSIAGWVLVPIAPHTLSNRPIVISQNSCIRIEVVSPRDATANFDAQTHYAPLQPGQCVQIRRSGQSVRFLHPLNWNYFDTLREKLHWNKGSA